MTEFMEKSGNLVDAEQGWRAGRGLGEIADQGGKRDDAFAVLVKGTAKDTRQAPPCLESRGKKSMYKMPSRRAVAFMDFNTSTSGW